MATEKDEPDHKPQKEQCGNRSDTHGDVTAEPGRHVFESPPQFVETHLSEDESGVNTDRQPKRRSADRGVSQNQAQYA